MGPGTPEFQRLRQLMLLSAARPRLEELKQLVRHWRTRGAGGQEGVNRAIVRAIDELQNRLDLLTRI